jgi:hypothetical protein
MIGSYLEAAASIRASRREAYFERCWKIVVAIEATAIMLVANAPIRGLASRATPAVVPH